MAVCFGTDGARKEIPKTAPKQFPLFDAEIGDKRRLRIPDEALPAVDWAAGISPTAPAAFEKMQAGRVRLLPGAAYDAAVASAGDNAQAQRDVSALIDSAKWERSNRIIVPRGTAMHVFGCGIVRGSIYVHPTPDCFELWGERYYAQWILDTRDRAADHLPG